MRTAAREPSGPAPMPETKHDPKAPFPLIFERSRPGRTAVSLPPCDVPERAPETMVPAEVLRDIPPMLPEVGELDLVRHYVGLSQRNLGVDTAFYPLGSCTMKYNPKVNEKAAALPGFAHIHPLQAEETVQGMLQVLRDLERILAGIVGMDAVSLQPAAGAHGEMAGLLVIKACQRERGEGHRKVVLIPDSAHGTNPATCALSGLTVVQVRSNARGTVDLDDLGAKLSPGVAALMITNPNTLGHFETDIAEIARRVHAAGGLVYMDGANLNAILGRARPGDFGVDVMHMNVHKTFSTPHGGGGPGAGPVAVKGFLEPYLPVPRIREVDGRLSWDWDRPKSIGKLKAFWGNVGVLLRAYAYIVGLGDEGLRRVSLHAVLNANYLQSRLRKAYALPYDRPCMHEFVLSAVKQRKYGVRALDIAKRLLDYGFHAPTIYFPLIVPEALMIEPTETESRETLDAFAQAMLAIACEARDTPDLLLHAPYTLPIRRLDEVRAAKAPVLNCCGVVPPAREAPPGSAS
jgi:glycine dehydrogenase subunit 2